jgi:hypothetical protein
MQLRSMSEDNTEIEEREPPAVAAIDKGKGKAKLPALTRCELFVAYSACLFTATS